MDFDIDWETHAMDIPLNLASIDQLVSKAREYFLINVLSWAMAAQIVVVGLVLFITNRAIRDIDAWFNRLKEKGSLAPEVSADLHFLMTFKRVTHSFVAFIFIWILYNIAEHFDWSREGIYTAGVILLAYTVMRLFTGPMKNRFWAGILTGAIWLYAALHIFHFIDPWLNFISQITFKLGGVHISLLQLARGLFIFLALYWLSRNLSIIWKFWLRANSGLAAAVQILFSRLGTIFLFSMSTVLVLHYLGIDLSVFALFGGALGLGLGFGLQKVFANLLSGFILLADKSIKPGDVIQMGDQYGWINFLGSRYISVVTRNGTEHLIPHEKLITEEVINWSYSQNLVRLKVPVGIAYATDLEKARDLMLETAAATARILKDPEPVCILLSFGDNAVNLELRVWINDPQNGLGPVKSNLLWGIWKRFRDHGIEIPYPQRDVHLKSISEDSSWVRRRVKPQ
jgi:small-conductance mechanosensitive channel